MEPAITLKNAYKDRKPKDGEDPKKVPQAFTFLQRQALPRRGVDLELDQRVPRAMRSEENSCYDIFALTKMNMSDSELCQAPLLVYPATCLGHTEHFFNRVNQTQKLFHPQLEPERAAELEELSRAIEVDFPNYRRAVDFYKRLLHPQQFETYPEIKFLKYPKANRRWCEINLGERPPGPKPHHLQVVFHRRR